MQVRGHLGRWALQIWQNFLLPVMLGGRQLHLHTEPSHIQNNVSLYVLQLHGFLMNALRTSTGMAAHAFCA